MKRIGIFFAILALMPAALAQRGRGGMGGMRGGGGGGRMGMGMDEHTTLLIFTALLNLTDAQQQQLGTVFDAAVKTAAPLNAQIETGKTAIFDAVKAGKSDDQTKALSDQEASLTSQLMALQTQTFSKMCAMLTAVQKTQVDDSMFTDIGQFLSSARPPLPEPALPGAAPLPPSNPTATPPPQ